MKLVLIFLFLFSIEILADEEKYLSVYPTKGQGISSLLEKYGIPSDKFYIDKFKELNSTTLAGNDGLHLNKLYQLPIIIYGFNGINIRKSIKINNYQIAKQIHTYNEKMALIGLKKYYKLDKEIWVPLFLIPSDSTYVNTSQNNQPIQKKAVKKKNSNIEPLFGKIYEDVKIISTQLDNTIFYLIAGHGGPDPGAIGFSNGYELHEHEYAYDVTLRLARKLMEHSAEVVIVVQDSSDGIRDERYLKNKGKANLCNGDNISANQKTRLSQRVAIVNNLFNKTAKTKRNVLVEIHVDSRINDKRIDIFFYHKEGDNEGKKMGETILQTIEDKYRKAQPNRGYNGTIAHRSLYTLRKAFPTSIYIELGNIQNPLDQVRILEPNNRQAIANWLCDGFIIAIQNEKK